MKLGEWLDAEGIDRSAFGSAIGRSTEAVRRYVSGDRIPDRETMPLIFRETSGKVTANDFFNIGEVPSCGRCGEQVSPDRIDTCASAHCPQRARVAA